jgi:hypothetical protein
MSTQQHPLLKQAFAYWNWKCALMSATTRSIVYLVTMMHSGAHGLLSIVLVEIGYVTLTAGIYAGMQQNALRLRSQLLGNLIVVVGVPGLAQTLDWFSHRLTHTVAPHKTLLAVSFFTVLSALFHLHVMRNGGFLTGQGSSLLDDFRRVPRFIAGFVLRPVELLTARLSRSTPTVEPEAGL